MLEQRIAEDLSVRQQMEQMEAFTRKYIALAEKSTGTVIIPTVNTRSAQWGGRGYLPQYERRAD